ncbi:hypothetical protein OH77DRAFT_1416108 [Trametes cingulata]|nr:hypothetical protein OH77DRAFT_1416108 [Trametes cingulata]
MSSPLDDADHHGELAYYPVDILSNKISHDNQVWESQGWIMPDRPVASRVPKSVLTHAMPTAELHPLFEREHPRGPPQRYKCIPQTLYGDGKAQEFRDDDVYFETPAGPGINLARALHGQVDDLYGRDEPAFSRNAKVTSKISLRIQFEGLEPYHRQIMALRSTSTAEPIALGKVAQKIAEEMKAYLKGETLYTAGRAYDFEEILLMKLRRATKGSWQPEFALSTSSIPAYFVEDQALHAAYDVNDCP